MTTPEVIPLVFVTDLVFAVLVAVLHLAARSRWTRRLTAVVFVYVLVEAFAHVPMERLAAELMHRWL